jgi:rhodanese-related sulfurtransferase
MRTLTRTYAAALLLLLLALGAFAQTGDGARRITPAEVRAAMESGRAVIVDVRGESSYEGGHVRGALSIPSSEILSRLDELPRDKTIITYCS